VSARLDLALRNDVGEIARARPALAAFLQAIGASRNGADVAHLAFEEIVTNIIKYGDAAGAAGGIAVGLDVEGTCLRIDFRDRGVAFDPTAQPPPEVPATLGESRVGGLGLHLVRQFAEEISYRREGDTNHLTVRIRIDR
jgi:anti-sigma regulatory factor (Ser/Thr protein kinase)